MSATNKFYQGTFTSTGAPISINLGFSPYEVIITNNTSAANLVTAAAVPLQAYWNKGMASDSARLISPTGSAGVGLPQPLEASYISVNGVLLTSTSQIAYAGDYTGTALTSASPASITGIAPVAGSAALQTGQTGILWLSQAAGASQWANAFYNFTATSATAVSIPGLNNTFTAGTAVKFSIVQNIGSQLAQTSCTITGVSAATSETTELTLSTNNSGVFVGSYIIPSIPTTYGTVASKLNPTNSAEINNLGGYLVTAVNGNVITILTSTTGLGFTYPTDATVQGSLGKTTQKPVAVPSGVSPNIYDTPQRWTGSFYVTLGSGVVGLSGNDLFVSASAIVLY